MSLALDVTRQHGGDWRGDYGVIPTPGHSNRDRGTIVRDRSDGRGVYLYSFNHDDHRALRTHLGLTDEQAAPLTSAERRQLRQQLEREKAAREGRQLAQCADLAQSGLPPEPGNPVRTYLAARGIHAATAALAVAAGALREHRDDHGRTAMLALAHNRNGVLRGVQLTKLKADGSAKRGSECDRLTFGPYKGSACRLFKLAGDALAVAEGVETALAFASLRKVPCWATFGTRNLEAFDPPPGIRTVIVAADGDRATKPGDFKGLDAADALFDRLRQRCRVIIAAAPADLDWLDVLNRGGEPCRQITVRTE